MRLKLATASLLALFALGMSQPRAAEDFKYYAPGDLADGLGRTGDRHIYVHIGFPLKAGPAFGGARAYANSQIHGVAGGNDKANYAYPWRDTFCEGRSWAMPLCPNHTGHQGVDIRPEAPNDGTWPVMAVADGVVTAVTPFTRVEVRSADSDGPFSCRYLHMQASAIAAAGIKVGKAVKRGDVIGKVSNIQGGGPDTTVHLHFDCTRQISGRTLFVPVYPALVSAYRVAWGLNALGDGSELGIDADAEIHAPTTSPSTSQPDDPSAPKTWRTRNYGAITPQTEADAWPAYLKAWPGLRTDLMVRDALGKIIPAVNSDESGIGLWWYWMVRRAGFGENGLMTFEGLAVKYSGASDPADPAAEKYVQNYVGANGGAGVAAHYFAHPVGRGDVLSLGDPDIRWQIAQTVFEFEAGKAAPFTRDVFERGIKFGAAVLSGTNPTIGHDGGESNPPPTTPGSATTCNGTEVIAGRYGVIVKSASDLSLLGPILEVLDKRN
jgi:hypothetical protein